MDIFKRYTEYAVCPACDNPIQIIGLMEQPGDGSLYARHVPKSILGLAAYRQESYDDCPLAVKNRTQVEKSAKKCASDGIGQKILGMLRDHFDRVILVLQKSIGIVISKNLAENMLADYLAEDGHLYKYASLLNVPWMLAYMATSKSLVGRIILDEEMRKAILAKVPLAAFSGEQLTRKGKGFLQVNMYFSRHTMQPRGNTVEESMRMVITVPGREPPEVVYEKRVTFDYEDFQKYLEIPKGKGFRKREFLDVAGDKLQSRFPQADAGSSVGYRLELADGGYYPHKFQLVHHAWKELRRRFF
jgi:hypothetical protein